MIIKTFWQRARTAFLMFTLVTAWIFSGWPVQTTNAAPISQYSGGLLVYADGTAGTPKYKVFDDATGFGAEQSASSVGSVAIRYLRVAASPTSDEWIIVTGDNNNVIKAQVCTGVDGGVSCGTPTQIITTGNASSYRTFDIAYEQLSGEALLVYGTQTADELRKIEWNGSWHSDAAITTTRTTSTVYWVELTARPGSDQIGIAYSDAADDVSAYRWSGSAVADEATQAVTKNATPDQMRKFDISFEASGDMIVMSPISFGGAVAYGQLSGTTWTFGTSTNLDFSTSFLDLMEPPPTGDVLAVYTNESKDGSTVVNEWFAWDGTGIIDSDTGHNSSPTLGKPYELGAVAYQSSTYNGVGVYASSSSPYDDIGWWTMSGTTVTTRTTNVRTRGASRWIDLFDYPNADKVLLITADANSDLWADTWDGASVTSTAWTDLTSGGALETILSSTTTDPVDFAFRLAPPAPTTYTQGSYLWYVDNDGTNPTAIWGTPDIAENTAIPIIPAGYDPPSNDQELRLRVNMSVSTVNLAIGGEQFKLQFKAGTDGSCTTGSWTDVGADAASAWQFATSSVTDGADITEVLSTTTTGKGQEYVKANPTTTNHVAVTAGQFMEYDFHIVGSGSGFASDTQYSFRVIESGGTVFDAYTNCPTLKTEPGIASLMRHGNLFSGQSELGFFWAN